MGYFCNAVMYMTVQRVVGARQKCEKGDGRGIISLCEQVKLLSKGRFTVVATDESVTVSVFALAVDVFNRVFEGDIHVTVETGEDALIIDA